MSSQSHSPVRTWRAAPHFRTLFGVLGAAVIGLGVVAESTDPGDSDLWRAGVVAFGAALAVWPHLGRVELHQRHVVLHGPFRSRAIQLDDVAKVEAGEAGLVFVRHDGRTALGSSLVGAKAPLLSWRGRRTRGDQMAEDIMAAAHRSC